MKEHKLQRLTVLVVTAIYLVIAVGTFFGFDPADLPKPTFYDLMSGVWAEEYETYLSEHLGFHDTLFRIKSQTDLFVGEKMVQGVYVTDDRLLEKLYSQDTPGAAALAEPVNAFYAATGIPTFMLLVPSASEIYESTLPANAVNAEQEQLIRDTYAETVNSVRCLDVYQALSAAKNDYIYYRTDRHWTCYGAYVAYQNIIQKMGFSAVPYQRYVISHLSTEFRGDLYAQTLYGGVRPDLLDYYIYERGSKMTSVTEYHADGTQTERGTIYDPAAIRSEDMYRFYLGAPCQKLVLRTNVESGKTLLLYKDDFADCMVPFLMQHYSEICIVDLQQAKDDLLAVADPSEYTQVLFLCSMQNWETLWK